MVECHLPSVPGHRSVLTLRPVVLASGSVARRALLDGAGLDFAVEAAALDETELKRSLTAEGVPPRDIADLLAEMKASRVSARHRDTLVIGADQVLVLDGRIFDKPADLAEARAHLEALRGRRHELISALVVAENGTPVWRHAEVARLEMRDFSDDFLAAYLATEGDALLGSVGAYRLEGPGVHLFSRVAGDHSTVLGLPLLPLLDYLRTRQAIRS